MIYENIKNEIRSEIKSDKGFVLSKNVYLGEDDSFQHVCVLGPCGSGKTTSFFIPTLLETQGTHSFVITDPKGELYYKTKEYLESKGIRVFKLNPLDSENSDFYYNPLLVAEDNTQIRELAQLILINSARTIEFSKDLEEGELDLWIHMAIPLFTASLAYFREFGEKKTINEAIDFILKEDDLKVMESTFSKSRIALNNFRIFKTSSGSEKTLSSIKSVLTSNIQLFLDEKIEEFTKTPFKMDVVTGKLLINEEKLFDPIILRQRPTALFVCVPEVKSDYMSPLMSVFYSQVFNGNIQYLGENSKTPVLYMLDEFINIGWIPGISKLVAVCRSRKMGFSIGIQSVEQLIKQYGEQDAYTLLDSLKTKVVFPGLTEESAKYVSNICGKEEVCVKTIIEKKKIKNFSDLYDDDINIEIEENKFYENLVSCDEIKSLEHSKVLIVTKRYGVFLDDKNSYFNNNEYLEKVSEI